MSTGILEDKANGRIANVKTLAQRLASYGEGFSIREYLDALALASGSLINAAYRESGKDTAVKLFEDELHRAALGKSNLPDPPKLRLV